MLNSQNQCLPLKWTILVRGSRRSICLDQDYSLWRYIALNVILSNVLTTHSKYLMKFLNEIGKVSGFKVSLTKRINKILWIILLNIQITRNGHLLGVDFTCVSPAYQSQRLLTFGYKPAHIFLGHHCLCL